MAFISRPEAKNFLNAEFYLNNNPDVREAISQGTFDNPLDHFLSFGLSEGRVPNQSLVFFNENSYLTQNSDVQEQVEAGIFDSGLDHFLSFGIEQDEVQARIAEGGTGYRFYNEQFYLNNNPDVQAAVNNGTFDSGLEHFIEFGLDEGLAGGRGAPSEALSFFNETSYLEQNPDVDKAIQQGVLDSGLEHFVRFGVNELDVREGTGYEFFDSQSYLNANPDVAQAVENNVLDSALEHYVKFGFSEGRSGLFTITDNSEDNAVSEGDTLTFTVESINGGSVGKDTEVTFSLAGDIDVEDIAGDSLTKSATIAAGDSSTSVSVQLAEDLSTEGLETITASATVLGDDSLESDSVDIEDTSTGAPTIADVTADQTTVNETDNNTVNFSIATENATEGDSVNLSFSGDISAEDIQGSQLPATASVGADGTVSVGLNFAADNSDEGAETFTLEASIGDTAIASPQVTVEDTSSGPTDQNIDGESSVGSAPATFDAGSGSINFVDSVGTGNNVEISNFGANDQITFQGVTADDVSFQESGGNTQFGIDDGSGTVSRITLVGVTTGSFSVSGFNEDPDLGDVTFA